MPAKLRRSDFCMLALAFASLHAEERTLRPQDLLDGLMQNNPEIQAARSRFEAATKRPSQAGTLPEPTASYTNLGVGHPFSRLNGSDFAYQAFGVSQDFPFPGKLGLASEEARRDAQIAWVLAVPVGVLHARGEIQQSSFSMPLEELLKSTADSPRVRAQQKLVDARAVGINRSLKDFRPDFGVTLQWQHTGSNFPDYYMATVNVKIPIYYARKQRYALQESYSRLNEAKQNYQSAQQQANYQVKEQYLSIQSSERILNLYKTTLMPQASLTVDSAVSAYEVGSIDFLSLLSNLTNLISLERQYYDDVARHEEAIARLEPIVGKELVPFREANR